MKRYVGALANRDPELMEELRSSFRNYGVEMIDLEPGENFDETPLRDHKVEVILPKLKASEYNRNLFTRLRELPVPFLNSLNAVEICQSRTSIFSHVRERLPHLEVPNFIEEKEDMHKIFEGGGKIFARRDAHHLPREERVLGVAGSMIELDALIADHPGCALDQVSVGGSHRAFRQVEVVLQPHAHVAAQRDRRGHQPPLIAADADQLPLGVGR